jgi:hypothetical protein
MSQPVLQLRMFDRDKDHATLVEWCDAHGTVATPAVFLPPLGVVTQMDGQDAAMLFVYYALSTPVAFVDCAATRPKLPLKDSVACLEFAYNFLKSEAKHDGYAVMLANVTKPFARLMGRVGFQTQEEGLTRMFDLAVSD